MAGKQVIFLCLASLSLVVSVSGDCSVEETQEVYIESTCELEDQTVQKVNGRCPMEEALIKGTPVCHEVETKNCILFMGNERCFPSFPREVCIDTYEILSMEMPPIRRATRGTDTCNTKVAVCGAKTTTEPKKEKCTASF